MDGSEKVYDLAVEARGLGSTESDEDLTYLSPGRQPGRQRPARLQPRTPGAGELNETRSAGATWYETRLADALEDDAAGKMRAYSPPGRMATPRHSAPGGHAQPSGRMSTPRHSAPGSSAQRGSGGDDADAGGVGAARAVRHPSPDYVTPAKMRGAAGSVGGGASVGVSAVPGVRAAAMPQATASDDVDPVEVLGGADDAEYLVQPSRLSVVHNGAVYTVPLVWVGTESPIVRCAHTHPCLTLCHVTLPLMSSALIQSL